MTFRRALGPFDATMIVIGGIVGSGIFINPYLVARLLDSSALVLVGLDRRRRDRAGRSVRVRRAGRRVPARRRAVCLPARRLASAGRFSLWLGAAAGHRDRRDRRGRDHVRDLRAAVDRPARRSRPCRWRSRAIVLLSVVNYFGVKPGSRVLNVLVRAQGRGARPSSSPRRRSCRRSEGWLSAARPRLPGSPGRAAGVRRGDGADPVRVRRLAERELPRGGDRPPRAEPSAQPHGRHRRGRADLRPGQRRLPAGARPRTGWRRRRRRRHARRA